MTSQPDPVTAVLGKMRQRAVRAGDVSQDTALRVGAAVNLACEDVPRLLAAAEAALALHAPGPAQVFGSLCAAHANHRYFSITATEAADVAACPKCSASISVPCSGCGTNGSVDRCPTRQAISAALLGEDAGHG